jgi:Tol biopolymer transport system component
MSPEQVQGLDVDHRTDIFSFGVVLYEMLAGESPFKGMHETAIMYEIVNVEAPPLSTIKPDIDPALDEIILECLEKDKDERCQSAKELARNLRKLKRVSSGSKASRVFQARSFASKETDTLKSEPKNIFAKSIKHISDNKISAAVISLLAVAVIILVLLKILQSPSSNFSEPVHFSFDIPGKSSQILNWEYVVQVSPDGKTIVYTDESGPTSIIYARDINKLVPYPIRGTENGVDPVFENNNWISFTGTLEGVLKKIPISGGVSDIAGTYVSNGLSWSSNGEIVLADAWPSGLTMEKAWNKKEENITEIDQSKNEGCHLLPYILPGGNAAVFTIWSKDGTFDDSKIAVVNLKTKERKNLSYNGVELQGTSPRFIQTPWGNYLLWSRSGNLYASTFDLSGLQVTGPEIKILEGISVNASSGKAAYSLTEANNGTLAYMPGKLDTAKNYLVWVDKNGVEKNALTNSGPYLEPLISKNGKAIIILTGPAYTIGTINFEKNKVEPLFTHGDNTMPQITPDGKSFVFVSNFENGKYYIYISRLDGIGGVKEIVATEGGYPEMSNLSPNEKEILYTFGRKIWIKDITGKEKPHLLFKSDAKTTSPTFSPDGKFIAYRSDEIDGNFKLFIRPFPITDTKVQVSIDDGIYPQWSADGSEIYYRDNDNIMAAKIQTSPELKVISRRLVCESKRVSSAYTQRDFTVAPDGRVLMLKSPEDQSKPVKVNVIVNWFAEVKQKLTGQD